MSGSTGRGRGVAPGPRLAHASRRMDSWRRCSARHTRTAGTRSRRMRTWCRSSTGSPRLRSSWSSRRYRSLRPSRVSFGTGPSGPCCLRRTTGTVLTPARCRRAPPVLSRSTSSGSNPRGEVPFDVDARALSGCSCVNARACGCVHRSFEDSAPGSVKKNVLPLPLSLAAQMRPPCASTMLLEMNSPSPSPRRSP
jgi:hypothetical protein